MNTRQAEAIYRITSTKDWQVVMDLFQSRVDEHHKVLEWEQKDVRFIQGQIDELRFSQGLKSRAEAILTKK
jgi:hypothetical protein